ncbi:ZIP family metal transporter [Sphingobacterium rhinopitheci]|uniref:ZIP family metal transporter n=1 Tax=Sphingobacterium rhinopitheci TaxID=2781960 RepID=UPI00293E35BF|nr:ZIP family metal transporter [Sphingobacterium rhinopitheci]MCI0920021.1 ZIP family metal transporter [Sphingobacterium rhinopitheci]
MTPFLIVAILFISAFISGLSVFFVKRNNANFLKLILSFSGAYLFAITVLHLIPHVYHAGGNTSPEVIGLYILGGFIFQLLLEQFSQGIEHGHIHHDENAGFPIGIMISLCLHAFLEGMPLVSGHKNELVFGIAIHHIPAAFALGSLLLNTSLRKNKIVIMLFIFAAMTPMGYLTSKALSQGEVSNISQYFDKIMAVVIGIFLHISTTILFESGSADHHHFNKKKMAAVFLGIAVSLTTFLIPSHDHGDHEGHNHESAIPNTEIKAHDNQHGEGHTHEDHSDHNHEDHSDHNHDDHSDHNH